MKVKNRYAKGRRNEWKSMRYLEEKGWMCFRTAGSHSDWDIIALHPQTGKVMLVQVKTNKKPPLQVNYHPYHSSWWLAIHVWKDRVGLTVYDAVTR